MNSALQNSSKNYQRYFFVFAVAVFVLLTSCPVKSSIKSLAGIPVNTESGLSKKNSILGNGSGECVIGETTDTEASLAAFNSNNLLPAVILTAAFLFLIGDTRSTEQPHPLYGNLKISGTLPIFLQYRKLII